MLGNQSLHLDLILQRDGNTQQWRLLGVSLQRASGKPAVGIGSCHPSLLGEHFRKGVELRIDPLDSCQVQLDEFYRGDFPCAQELRLTGDTSKRKLSLIHVGESTPLSGVRSSTPKLLGTGTGKHQSSRSMQKLKPFCCPSLPLKLNQQVAVLNLSGSSAVDFSNQRNNSVLFFQYNWLSLECPLHSPDSFEEWRQRRFTTDHEFNTYWSSVHQLLQLIEDHHASAHILASHLHEYGHTVRCAR